MGEFVVLVMILCLYPMQLFFAKWLEIKPLDVKPSDERR